MTSSEIFSVALDHVPALLIIWLTIYVAYWMVGIAKWPAFKWRDQLLEKWCGVDIISLGGFRFSSLVIISLVGLFLELLLIRWIASEIRIFAYFQSLVLIAAFLGFGLGAYLTRRRLYIAYTVLPLVGLVLLTELPWEPVRRLVVSLSGFIAWFSDVHVWSTAHFAGNFLWGVVSAGVAMSIVIPIFGLIAITMLPMGQLVGWYLENSPRGILAYSVNVVASVVGIWLFTALGFFSTPPVVWFIVLGVGLVLFFWRLPRLRNATLLSFAAIIALFVVGTQKPQWFGEFSWKGSTTSEYSLQPGKSETFWSPYQKLTLIPLKYGDKVVRYILNTNDSWYQQILDLSDSAVTRDPELYPTTPLRYYQYNLPYQFYKNPDKVLIAGAGMGNDAAAALRGGAQHVTAVEIDPLIYEKGKELHFEHPYDSDKVEFHIDDARSYVQNTKEKYDLVVFSILDSQTTSSSYTNIRLDNYVYTLESMEATKNLLRPNGLFVMSFSSERPWFTQRLRDVVTKAFGKEPLVFNTNVSFLVAGNGNRVEEALAADPELKSFVEANSDIPLAGATPITDDWPYLYQQFRGIPVIVWMLSLGLIGISWVTFNKLKPSRRGIQWHFFFLGAAFMLLEVQIISKSALLFGTTWLINSIVISTLLLFVLLSNLVVARFPNFPRKWAFLGLFVTLALAYLIPTNALFFDSLLARGAITMALYCSPVFFAGMVFISSFKEIGFQAEAFGSNLLGVIVGGLLQALSFVIGIKALVIVGAFIYLLAWVTMGRVRRVAILPPEVIPS